MIPLECGHLSTPAEGRVCLHLLETADPEYVQSFTGRGLDSELLCGNCAQGSPRDPTTLRTVCRDCFARVQRLGSFTGITGKPEVRERPGTLVFRHAVHRLAEPLPVRLLDLQPVRAVDQNLWVALADDGRFLRLDLETGSVVCLGRLPEAGIDLTEAVSLHLSPDAQLAAVVNSHGQHGVVIDLTTGSATLSLTRDTYHNEHCDFPVGFADLGGRLLLIHATGWNRLDLSDPRTGQLLTPRSFSSPDGGGRPAHYLDYFHTGLVVSPDGEHVADNGWVWHPVGVVTTWNVRAWLGNVWESEDGPSRKNLCWRDYHWHSSLCWVGTQRLAVWGYGRDDEWLLPAACIYDVVQGQQLYWFPGPQKNLVFDDYLFSFDQSEGTAVWDVDTGERLLHQEGFCPFDYHPGVRSFLTLEPDGSFRVSRLGGQYRDPNWLSHNGSNVVRLAQGILRERDFAALPVLADALEEAGCQEASLLEHCRRPGPHTHRCWVLDRLLDPE